MTEDYRKEIVQRITKNLLDIQLLRLIQIQPLIWGYRIKKTVEAESHVKLGHGALYPTLNTLERRGFLESSKRREGGRARKAYKITKEGQAYLKVYYAILGEQLESPKTS